MYNIPLNAFWNNGSVTTRNRNILLVNTNNGRFIITTYNGYNVSYILYAIVLCTRRTYA